MVTADPQRTPTLTMFALPDWFLFAAAPNCTLAVRHRADDAADVDVRVEPRRDPARDRDDLARAWSGRECGTTATTTTWVDHTDVRPTMLSLLGLQDTYVHDGRVLIDQLDACAVPQSLRAHRETLRRLGEVYKQLNAPFGEFGIEHCSSPRRRR